MSAIAKDRSEARLQDTVPIRVLVADDHPLMLAGVRRALERDEGIEVVGEARSGAEVLDMIERRRPELVLMDLQMPGMTGAECIAKIRASWPEIKVVILSASDDRRSIDAALNAGASAYVIKSVIPSDIASLLRQAASGCVFHSTSGRQAVGGVPGTPEPEGPMLTEREHTILEAIAAGMTTAAISKELWVSEHTVKFHLTNIYRKLGVANRTAAVRYALENGLIAA